MSLFRGLADVDKDGNLNFNEFSIACKLITMKLKGFELPKILPAALSTSLTSPSAAPTAVPVMQMPPNVGVSSMQAMAPVLPQTVPVTVPIMAQVPVASAPMQPVLPTIPLGSASGAPIRECHLENCFMCLFLPSNLFKSCLRFE
jgi:hypothetical protein